MASIVRKSVPSARIHNHAQAYSYAAAPSTSDDDLMGNNITPSTHSERLNPVATQRSSNGSKVAPKVKERAEIEHEKTSPWGIHWTSPALMLGLFALGIGSSIAHHLFYDSLDGTDVESTMAQEWAIRVGTGLAFVTKASLAAAVGVGYTQRLWTTVTKKSVSMAAMDDLFQLTMNPVSFFSWEVLRKGKLVCFMAASMWLIPLIATITPATLSIEAAISQNVTSILVPTLGDVQTYNFVSLGGSSRYTGPSTELTRVFRMVTTLGRPVRLESPYQNMTYDLEFLGPSVRCYNLDTPSTDAKEMAEKILLQEQYASVFGANFTQKNFESPALLWWWSGTSNSTVFLQGSFFDYEKTACNFWNTSYNARFTFGGSDQVTTLTSVQRLHEVETFLYEGVDEYDENLEAVASREVFLPYRVLIHQLLNVTIGMGSSGYTSGFNADVALSPFMQCRVGSGYGNFEDCDPKTVAQHIEELSYNFTLSFLSSTLLSNTTKVDATISTSVNRYSYNWRNLVLAYGIGIVVTLIGISIGGYSYLTNGYSASMSFSSIVFTTRNRDLDNLSIGRCFPALPLGPELGKIKLRYGLLRSGTGMEHEHAAFGHAETITELRKGTKCA